MCEILAPAGSKENLISAINAGANAVYLGLTDFSARKTAENFTLEDLKYAVAYAKTFGVKVYVTVNTLIKDSEIDALMSDINVAYSYGVDAFILQDVFLGEYIKKVIPNICLHLSTQAGVCNEYGAKLAKNLGFSRVILARETKIKDIEAISKIIETEVFIQGALCTSLSGHCYFSSFVGGNSGNRGLCKQPCRKKYSIEYNGKTVKNGYLISLSDLSVGEDIKILKDLGVSSFKIEGRLRSKEYVYSAVKYYRQILEGQDTSDILKALKVSFNRGNYTKGLAFGQKNDFISDKVQNNIGFCVGKIKKVTKDEIIFDRNFDLLAGDSFKIIRNGYEVGNATTVLYNEKIAVKYSGDAKVGDSVHLTKKSDLYSLICKEPLKKEITVSVNLKLNDKLKFSCNGVSVETESVVETAKSSPISKEDVILSLNKTDNYPFKVSVNFENFNDNCFVVKSVLNKLRVKLYEELFYGKIFKNAYNIEKYARNNELHSSIRYTNAVIVSEINDDCFNYENVIYFPSNYSKVFVPKIDKKIWLYVPPFASGEDLKIIDKIAPKFYGVYGDGVWAYQYAKDNGHNLFAGVGFNVFNSVDVKFLTDNGVLNLCASKELTIKEINSLNYPLFVLNGGAIEVMDLIYCPFSKNCNNCEINGDFTLVDEGDRRFPVKKYILSECRFKVYNNACLKQVFGCYDLVDMSIELPNITTNGNYIKGIK